MENQTAAKQSKGIKKLWLKFKASMKADQAKSPKSSTTPTASKPTASTTPVPVATQTVAEPTSQQVPEPSNTTVQPDSKNAAEDVKPTPQPLMATDIIQVDDDEVEDADEK